MALVPDTAVQGLIAPTLRIPRLLTFMDGSFSKGNAGAA
jgi:hypothetical protein